MRTFVFRCPTTNLNVQAWIEDGDPVEADGGRFSVDCLACRQIHFLDPLADRVIPPESP